MFGQDDNNQNQQDENIVQPINTSLNDSADDTTTSADDTQTANAASDDSLAEDITASTNSEEDTPAVDVTSASDSGSDVPVTEDTESSDEVNVSIGNSTNDSSDSTDNTIGAPSPLAVDEPEVPEEESSSPASSSSASSEPDAELLELKRSALQELSPLVDQLDQTNEEKFKTTMMMIQATDDKSLLPKALDAAKAIEDEKIRAQALLDVVNEINYFTTQHEA